MTDTPEPGRTPEPGDLDAGPANAVAPAAVATEPAPEAPDGVPSAPPDDVPSAAEPAARDGVPNAIRVAADWSWRLVAIGAAVAGAFWLVLPLKTVVVPVMVAALLASLLAPLVTWVQTRLRLHRGLASITTMLVVIAVFAVLVVLAGASIADQFGELKDRALAGFQEALTWLSTGPLKLDEAQLDEWTAELTKQIQANTSRILSGALSVTSSVGHVAAGSLIALFCLFFFLKDGRAIWTWIVRLFPVRAREQVDGAGLRSWVSLGHYSRTQILVAFVDAIGIGVGAAILGVPLALPIGILVFIGSFIPIVGAIVTGSVAIAVALVDGGPVKAVIMLVIVLGVQQVESHVLQPFIMGGALKLHPVAVLLAVAAGTLVAGIVGALFAVPLVAVLNTAINYLHGRDSSPPDRRARFAELTRRWRRA